MIKRTTRRSLSRAWREERKHQNRGFFNTDTVSREQQSRATTKRRKNEQAKRDAIPADARDTALSQSFPDTGEELRRKVTTVYMTQTTKCTRCGYESDVDSPEQLGYFFAFKAPGRSVGYRRLPERLQNRKWSIIRVVNVEREIPSCEWCAVKDGYESVNEAIVWCCENTTEQGKELVKEYHEILEIAAGIKRRLEARQEREEERKAKKSGKKSGTGSKTVMATFDDFV